MANKQEHEEQKSFLKGTAIGVVVGSVAGAIAGVLFAPQSGKETRAQLGRVLQKSGRDLERKIAHVKDSVKDFSDATGKDLAKLLDRADELKTEIAAFGKNVFDKGVDINEDVRKEAKRLIDESQKVAADLDRILAKKLTAAKELATDTGKQTTAAVKKNVKK